MFNLLQHIEADWARDADGPAARDALNRWTEFLPELAGFASPGELVRRCRSRDLVAVGAAEGLVGHAAADPWAARTVLAAVLPGLARLVGSNRGLIGGHREPFATVDELEQFVLCAAYECIARGPTPGATRQLRAVVVVTGERLRSHARAHHRACRRRLPLVDIVADPRDGRPTDAEELTAILVDAVERKVLRVLDARLVYTTRVAGHSPAEVAATLHWQPSSLRRRRNRAERALAADFAGHGASVPRAALAASVAG